MTPFLPMLPIPSSHLLSLLSRLLSYYFTQQFGWELAYTSSGGLHPAKAHDKKMCSTVESLTRKLSCDIIVLLRLHLCSASQSEPCKRRRIMSVALTTFNITQRCTLKSFLYQKGSKKPWNLGTYLVSWQHSRSRVEISSSG